MKKVLSLMLAFVMCFGIMAPTVYADESMSKELKANIETVKQMLKISNDFKNFNYESQEIEGKTYWRFSWSEHTDGKTTIDVTVTSDAEILSYYKYDGSFKREIKFPKYSKSEAEKFALDFIKLVAKDEAGQIKLIDNGYIPDLNASSHNYSYVRMVNGVEFFDNNMYVSLNRETGEIKSFSKVWDKELVFPDKSKAVDLNKAKENFKSKLGYKLEYRVKGTNTNETPEVYLAYVPNFESNEYIDAMTGEKIKLDYGYPMARGEEMAKSEDTANFTSMLSPEEKKALESASTHMSKEQAEKAARDTKILGLDKDFKVTAGSLANSWPFKDKYVWNLYFSKVKDLPTQEKIDYRNDSVDVKMDANTGKVISFYINKAEQDYTKQPTFDKEKAQKEVEKFLKEFAKTEFEQSVLKEEQNDMPVPFVKGAMEEQKPRYFTFKYERVVDGVDFPDNGITVGFDAVEGKIINYRLNWYDVKFPAKSEVISMEKLYENMFKEIDYKLVYKKKFMNMLMPVATEATLVADTETKKEEVKLVYTLDENKPQFFDAKTGDLVNWNGEKYEAPDKLTYSDIAGNEYEKEIKRLAEYGIGFKGGEFKPNESINQLDFFRMFIKAVSYSYGDLKTKDEIDNMYETLEYQEIIKAGERNEKEILKRGETSKFFVRALGYGKVAELTNIFKYPFEDEVKEELKGFITIANEFKIVVGQDGKFNPEKELTRADAAMMIHNYLAR